MFLHWVIIPLKALNQQHRLWIWWQFELVYHRVTGRSFGMTPFQNCRSQMFIFVFSSIVFLDQCHRMQLRTDISRQPSISNFHLAVQVNIRCLPAMYYTGGVPVVDNWSCKTMQEIGIILHCWLKMSAFWLPYNFLISWFPYDMHMHFWDAWGRQAKTINSTSSGTHEYGGRLHSLSYSASEKEQLSSANLKCLVPLHTRTG